MICYPLNMQKLLLNKIFYYCLFSTILNLYFFLIYHSLLLRPFLSYKLLFLTILELIKNNFIKSKWQYIVYRDIEFLTSKFDNNDSFSSIYIDSVLFLNSFTHLELTSAFYIILVQYCFNKTSNWLYFHFMN